MTPDDLSPLIPDPSTVRSLDDYARAAAEGLRRATAVAPPPLGRRPRGIAGRPSPTQDHPTLTLAGPRPRKRLVVVALAAAVVASVAVAVTRTSPPHHPKPVAPASGPVPVPEPQLYWWDGPIGRANIDGTDMVRQLIPVEVFESPCGLAVDHKYVYWSTATRGTGSVPGGTLARAKRDGTGVDDSFITTNPYTARCIAVDGAHIYWTGYNTGTSRDTIGRANLDGTGVQESFISGITGWCGLAVDGTHIYWVDSQRGVIGRANLDGTGVNQDFITGLGAASDPSRPWWCGVVVDGAHIYFGTPNGTIGRANLDGTDVNESFITGPSMSGLSPVPCAHDSSYLYWVLIGPSKPWIGRARLDGTDVQADFINVQPDFSTGVPTPGSCAIAR